MSRALAFICLSLLYVISFSGVCKAEEEVPQLLRDAKDYEANNQYGVAFEKIINCAKNTEDKACYRELGEFLDRRKNVLPPLEHEQITIFSPQEISMGEYIAKAKDVMTGYGIGTAAISSYGAYIGGIAGAGAATAGAGLAAVPILAVAPVVYVWIHDDIQLTSEESNKIILEEKNKHEKLLKDIESLKSYVMIAQKVTKDYLVENKFDKDITNVYANIEKLKEYLKSYRTAYLSYSVVSPTLALSSQLIYIAKRKTLVPFSADEQTLRLAAEVMAEAASGQIIREVTSDVRKQFLAVNREFKQVAGNALLDEFKVIQTLTDKIANNSLGASAWWE